MTDLVKLAQRLHRRIKWQEIPEELYSSDLIDMLEDAIRMLYVISGRTFQFSDDKFVVVEEPDEDAETQEEPGNTGEEEKEDELKPGTYFDDDLELDEQEWILLEGEIAFYNLALSNVDDLQSYTTDAMAVTHGDKPYKNIKQTVDDRKSKQNDVWVRMVRFNQLGVSG